MPGSERKHRTARGSRTASAGALASPYPAMSTYGEWRPSPAARPVSAARQCLGPEARGYVEQTVAYGIDGLNCPGSRGGCDSARRLWSWLHRGSSMRRPVPGR
jgi:hypothetical protein